MKHIGVVVFSFNKEIKKKKGVVVLSYVAICQKIKECGWQIWKWYISSTVPNRKLQFCNRAIVVCAISGNTRIVFATYLLVRVKPTGPSFKFSTATNRRVFWSTCPNLATSRLKDAGRFTLTSLQTHLHGDSLS